MNLFSLIPAPYRMIAAAIAVAAVIAGLFYVKHIYDESVRAPIKRELKLTNDMLTACRKNGEALKTSIDRQNTAIDALKTGAEKRAADSAKAVAEAKKLTTKSEQRVNEILASAPLSNDLCESARLRMVPQ